MNEKARLKARLFSNLILRYVQAASTVTTLFKTSTVPPLTAKRLFSFAVRTRTSPDCKVVINAACRSMMPMLPSDPGKPHINSVSAEQRFVGGENVYRHLAIGSGFRHHFFSSLNHLFNGCPSN
jgi:hypothetical protein